jgi:c-di-GMP-binding flagellar brake protein YcgR
MEENPQERRKHVRLNLTLPMHLQWVNEEGVVSNKSCDSVNVSTGGVYYKSNKEIPLNMDATVIFNLPVNDLVNFRVLRTRGKVVRVEKSEKDAYGVALEFLGELKFSTVYND